MDETLRPGYVPRAVTTHGDILYTVGHSTHEAEEFVALLRGAGIECVADVRRYPGSKRNPQFGREALAKTLADAGIGYLFAGDELGGRRKPAADSPNGGWRVAQFQGYADHMASPEFEAGLARVLEEARNHATTVMCAEGAWQRCHRRLVSDAALVRGFEVRHVLRDGSIEPHQLTEFAVADGTVLTYPESQPRLEI
jgi:uncharacterized protein (DUF488 family)